MKWYEGNIAEAVTLARKNGSIFVVFVEGEDDESRSLLKLIDNKDVTQTLETEHFVVIKIKANSVSYQQFSEIYKQVPAPSIYFIGKTGSPLEIITQSKNEIQLLDKIKEVLEKHGVITLPNFNTASTSTSMINAEKDTNVCENDICKISPKPSVNKTDEINTADATNEIGPGEKHEIGDKVQHAKDLIEKKRETKKAEEEEKEKMQEIERRKAGQSVQNFKKWQQEQEFKQLMEQRDKEKKEQQAARQRILAQIEQDKTDRATRFQTNQNNPSTSKQTSSPQPTRKSTVDSNKARLQFKLPDGTSHTQEFPNDNTLQDIRDYVRNNINLPFNDFTMSTTFPRREFMNIDASKNLIELELVPNAVILILPLSHGAVSTNPGNIFYVVLWSVVTPFLNIFGYIKNLIYGNTPSNTSNSGNPNNKRPADNKNDTTRVTKKRPGDTSSVIRRQGNIHRLGDRTDSEDENNTWNGNSTQQM